MSLIELDDLDRRILDLLGEDARLSNRSIARRLGLVEGTIRARIKRLQQRRLLRFTAITDNRQHGRPSLAFIGIRNDTRMTRALAATIAEIEEVRSVIITLGRFNLLAVGLFPTLEDLIELANNRILVLPGVTQVETSVVVKSIKYNERMAKIGFGAEPLPIIDGDEGEEDDEDDDQSAD
jgi:Lrp/AsnC family transcriptional regulator for asnA, asnC and gidA